MDFPTRAHTQLLALAAGRPELGALCPGMATWDVRDDWAYEGGAFALLGNLHWGLQMGAEQARLEGDAEAFQALHAASRVPPLNSPVSCRPEVLETFARYSHYRDWIENPAPGPYWDRLSVGRALEGRAMDVPMLHFGGWHDFMLRGTLRIFKEARARSREPQRLVVGPWTHMPWGGRVGAMDFGAEARGFVDPLQIAWFDRFLKDIDNGVDRAASVRLFDLIAKTWRDFEDWPASAPRRSTPIPTGSRRRPPREGCGRRRPPRSRATRSFTTPGAPRPRSADTTRNWAACASDPKSTSGRTC